MESQLNIGGADARGKILVLFPGALGDFICFLPALDFLAKDGRVDLLARAEYAGLVAPSIHASSIERYELRALFVAGAARDERLRRFFASYRSIYSWTGSGDRNFVDNLTRLGGGKVRLFPFRPSAAAGHISEYFLACVEADPAREKFPAVWLRSDAVLWGRNWLRERGLEGGTILALAPGSGAREKNWPAEFFREVGKWWQNNGGNSFAIFGPVEEERFECDRDWNGVAVARNLDLEKVAALLSLSDVYLGNDSGLTHLAAAVGVETIALFGPTDPQQWAPRGRRVQIVSRNVECAPCAHQAMKTCPHRKCLTTLAPEGVIDFLRDFSLVNTKNALAAQSLTRG